MPTATDVGSRADLTWLPDPELDSYEIHRLDLPDLKVLPEEPEGALHATLVRRSAPTRDKAVLYVHGWDDYFFQQHLADEMADAGYDFYAIDLHRYGRSLREGQLAGFCADLADYHHELSLAVDILRASGHEDVVVMGHSTGGLVASLWLAGNPGLAQALVLNSPWLELRGYPALRPAIQPMVTAARQVSATAALPVSDLGFYRRSISATEDGEWDYNLALKGDKRFAVRMGWLAAIMAGHKQVAAGLGIDVPVFMAISSRSEIGLKWSDSMHTADIVLDVEQLASRAPRLGRHVTLVRIEGGKHDLALSREPARAEYFGTLRRWLATYG